MSIELPAAVAAYFIADRQDGDAVARCFTEEGSVRDEGRLHRGRAAIARWKAEAAARYRYTSEPIAVEQRDGVIVVTGRVTGDFPGSPADLRYRFALDGERIAALEIAA